MTSKMIAAREALMLRIDDLPARPYPADLITFASCHPSYAEAREVDQAFFGKTPDQVDSTILRSGYCSAGLFLEVPAMLYFLPRLLKEMLAHPYSMFTANALMVYGVHLTDDRRLKKGLYREMSVEECEIAFAVISWLKLLRPARAGSGLRLIRERNGKTILEEKRKAPLSMDDDHPNSLGPWNRGVLHEDWGHLRDRGRS